MLLIVPALAACALVGWWAGGRALARADAGWRSRSGCSSPPARRARRSSRSAQGLGAAAGRVVRRRVDHESARSRSSRARCRRSASTFAIGRRSVAVRGEAAGRGRAHGASRVRAPAWTRGSTRLGSRCRRRSEWQRAHARQSGHGRARARELGRAARSCPRSTASAAIPRCWRSSRSRRSRSRGRCITASSRARIGPPLAPLKEFRFNDQLVWGLIAGVTCRCRADARGVSRRRTQPAACSSARSTRCAGSAC